MNNNKDNLVTGSKKIEVQNNNKSTLILNDAELLAYMAADVRHTYATNGKHYWYYVFEDIKECNFITYLFNRNGLYPTLHYSHYLDDYKLNPVLRIRSRYVNKNDNIKTFVSLINASRTLLLHKGNGILDHMVRAMDDFSKKTR